MNKERTVEHQEYAMRVASAMAIAGALVTGWTSGVSETPLAVPLSSLAEEARAIGILEIGRLLIVSILLLKGRVRTALFASGASAILYWLARYSIMGAFIPMVAVLCLFLGCIWNRDSKTKQVLATVFLGATFLVAALQKINSGYLSGLEFTSREGFLSFARHHLNVVISAQLGIFLAMTSVVSELILAAGLLMGIRFFSHLAVALILFLTILNPPVSFVYLYVGSLAVLADPKFAANLQNSKFGEHFTLVSAWALLQLYLFPSYLFENSGASQLGALFRPLVFVLFCGWAHLHFAKQSMVEGFFIRNWKDAVVKNRGPIALLLFYFLGSYLFFQAGGPSPLGLSMFSSQVRKSSSYQLEFTSREDCLLVSRSLKLTVVADVSVKYSEDSCVLSVPTESGLEYVERKICRYGIRGTMITKNRLKGMNRNWNCND
ncbi:MAG: hypothetical protein J0L82_10015 [Deltaproteobacteria bacterium]|nr:hypothetical protein [Deltaproteobacteria bacterium]